jgi:AcrR family transcriptional regulator
MPRPSATGGSRRSVDDWIKAGFAIIAEEGMNALKIDRLCERLGVTKGSFYWHFEDMASYRAVLVQSWGELRDEDRRQFDEMGDLPPDERLSRMMASLVSPRHWTLERAMREWARSDDAVAKSVREADRRLMRAIQRAFLDYGFDAEDADFRANAAFAAGIGLLHLSGPKPSVRAADQGERFLSLLLER